MPLPLFLEFLKISSREYTSSPCSFFSAFSYLSPHDPTLTRLWISPSDSERCSRSYSSKYFSSSAYFFASSSFVSRSSTLRLTAPLRPH